MINFSCYDSGFPKFYNVQSYRVVVYSAWLLGIVFIGIYTGNLVAALSTMTGKLTTTRKKLKFIAIEKTLLPQGSFVIIIASSEIALQHLERIYSTGTCETYVQ